MTEEEKIQVPIEPVDVINFLNNLDDARFAIMHGGNLHLMNEIDSWIRAEDYENSLPSNILLNVRKQLVIKEQSHRAREWNKPVTAQYNTDETWEGIGEGSFRRNPILNNE